MMHPSAAFQGDIFPEPILRTVISSPTDEEKRGGGGPLLLGRRALLQNQIVDWAKNREMMGGNGPPSREHILERSAAV